MPKKAPGGGAPPYPLAWGDANRATPGPAGSGNLSPRLCPRPPGETLDAPLENGEDYMTEAADDGRQ